jgi:ribose transport system substrate-binding protein
MRTILLAEPDVDVQLGADTSCWVRRSTAAGKARPDQFLGGIDGEPAASTKSNPAVLIRLA